MIGRLRDARHGLCAAAWCLLLVACVSARADGGFFGKLNLRERAPVSAPGQKALVIRDGPGHEVLLLQTTYRGPASEFAWVVPVPGRPAAKDVFLANPAAFELAERTRPEFFTIYGRRRSPGFIPIGLGFPALARAMWTSMGSDDAGARPAVHVHARMPVGDYDVSILSAERRGVLTLWLAKHGYAVPRRAQAVLDSYVGRGWHFVALRVRPQVQKARPLLHDVEPIGIRFPSKQLVYPLTISRVSAGARTNLLLVVFDRSGVQCRELPTVAMPAVEGKPAQTYQQLAREALRAHGGRALLCEGRMSVLGPRATVRPPLQADGTLVPRWAELVATRLTAELPPDAMRDLTFEPTPDAAFAVRVTRVAIPPVPAWAAAVYSPWVYYGVSLLFFVALGAALGGAGKSDAEGASTADWGPLVVGMVCAMFLLVGVRGLWYLPVFRLPILAFLCAWAPVGVVRERRRPAAGRGGVRALPAFIVLAFLGWAATMPLLAGTYLREGASDGAEPLLLAGALAGLLVASWQGALRWEQHLAGGARAKAAAIAGAILAWVVLIGSPVNCALLDAMDATQRHQARLLKAHAAADASLAKAVTSFREATGAYPATLTDLAGRPAVGLDSSGNRVPIERAPEPPLLQGVPVDPLTGRSDTWVYDVRSPYLVESGAFQVTVRRVEETGTPR